MSIKLHASLLALVISAFLLCSCTKDSSPTLPALDSSDYLRDPKFFMYNLDWHKSDILIGQMCLTDMKTDGSDIGRVIVWNKSTNHQRLIYEGKEMAGFMPSGMVFGQDGLFYTFDSHSCLTFDDNSMQLKQVIRRPEGVGGFYPSIYGQFVMRTDEGLGILSANEPERITLIKKDRTGKTKNGEFYQLFYETPRWSPDGKWITFYQMTADFLIPPQIGIISKEGTKEKFFNFEKATNYTWSTDSEHLVVINEGNIFEGPLEIRVFNILSGVCHTELFDKPIGNQKIEFFNILDVFQSKVLLQTHFDYQGDNVKPLLLYDWETGEKKWLTDLDYWSVAAAFSPDGKTIAVTGNDPKEPIEFIQID